MEDPSILCAAKFPNDRGFVSGFISRTCEELGTGNRKLTYQTGQQGLWRSAGGTAGMSGEFVYRPYSFTHWDCG